MCAKIDLGGGPCNCKIEEGEGEGRGKILSCVFCGCRHYEVCATIFDDGDEHPGDIFVYCLDCSRNMSWDEDSDSDDDDDKE